MININKEEKTVQIKVEPTVPLSSEAQKNFDKSVADTAGLIRVLNFDYIPLYNETVGRRIENQRALGPEGEQDPEKRKVLVEELRKISEHEKTDEYTEKLKAMNAVGDNMKFTNPIVWMMYKYFAYQNRELNSKPIRTVKDLVDHCEKPDYICTKRFHFINKWLDEKGFGSLRGKEGNIDLSAIFTDPNFIEISLDRNFMAEWNKYEKIGDSSTEKWKEYIEHLNNPQREISKVSEPNFRPLSFKKR